MLTLWESIILSLVPTILQTLIAAGVVPGPTVLPILQVIDATLDQVPGVDPTKAPPTPPAA